MKNQPVLILMTKKPVAGEVKTRLTRHISAKTAASIALEMIVDTVEKTVAYWPGELRLLVAPNADHRELKELANQFRIAIGTQADGDLGQKMESAICDGLHTAPATAVMGCDIPDINQAILKLAYERLCEGHNVFGPSADGGFYFAGLNECKPGMFKDIEWSNNRVLETVLHRMQACKIRVDVLLPCLQDIDNWRDFEYLAQNQPRYSQFLN